MLLFQGDHSHNVHIFQNLIEKAFNIRTFCKYLIVSSGGWSIEGAEAPPPPPFQLAPFNLLTIS